jgi:hypothetical protein
METDPSLEEMELDDEVDLANWEANEFVWRICWIFGGQD